MSRQPNNIFAGTQAFLLAEVRETNSPLVTDTAELGVIMRRIMAKF